MHVFALPTDETFLFKNIQDYSTVTKKNKENTTFLQHGWASQVMFKIQFIQWNVQKVLGKLCETLLDMNTNWS